MPRAALAYLPSPASPRPARPCPQPRRKHYNPFSRYPSVQPKPRLGVKNYAPQNAPGLEPETHANPPGITPVAEDAVVGCSVAAESNVARFVYDAKAARYRSAESGQFVSARDLPWPGNAGFSSSAMETVPAGRILDRFGNARGRYLGEPGATASARGMAPGADAMPNAQYRVLTPFQARVGPAASVPDFGASGGATQYLSGKSVQQLIDAGHLVRVK
jgi:Tuberculosis necrotizing toxin